jgi:hypothetical protein
VAQIQTSAEDKPCASTAPNVRKSTVVAPEAWRSCA